MTNFTKSHLNHLAVVALSLGLSACGITSEVINNKANEQRLLKAGALDVGVAELYDTYSFNFLNRYRVSHKYISTDKCHYANDDAKSIRIKRQPPNFGDDFIYETLPIYEKDGHTLQGYPADQKPKKLDKYTLSEWQNGTDANEKPRIAKGFQPMCFETWQGTQHFLSISLNKRKLAIPNVYGFKDGVISHQIIGNNHWDIQKFDYQPYAINSSGRLVESWVLPIADTGYTFIFEFGANLDSLKHPAAHAQMQAIFKHLIESVNIEPIK